METVMSFNTQPPEGGWIAMFVIKKIPNASFNTQPPEGGWPLCWWMPCTLPKFQHTAARRRLAFVRKHLLDKIKFQHTAARRRLASEYFVPLAVIRFNTQPPEGGWKTTGLLCSS